MQIPLDMIQNDILIADNGIGGDIVLYITWSCGHHATPECFDGRRCYTVPLEYDTNRLTCLVVDALFDKWYDIFNNVLAVLC